MNLTLTRKQFSVWGIFGFLKDEKGSLVAFTLEHSYDFLPKLSPGVYLCQRGEHKLSNLAPFTTFEVMNVPDFQGKKVEGILFHAGNYDADSHGCILLGTGATDKMVTQSKLAFEKFMTLQAGIDSFTLTVV